MHWLFYTFDSYFVFLIVYFIFSFFLMSTYGSLLGLYFQLNRSIYLLLHFHFFTRSTKFIKVSVCFSSARMLAESLYVLSVTEYRLNGCFSTVSTQAFIVPQQTSQTKRQELKFLPGTNRKHFARLFRDAAKQSAKIKSSLC